MRATGALNAPWISAVDPHGNSLPASLHCFALHFIIKIRPLSSVTSTGQCASDFCRYDVVVLPGRPPKKSTPDSPVLTSDGDSDAPLPKQHIKNTFAISYGACYNFICKISMMKALGMNSSKKTHAPRGSGAREAIDHGCISALLISSVITGHTELDSYCCKCVADEGMKPSARTGTTANLQWACKEISSLYTPWNQQTGVSTSKSLAVLGYLLSLDKLVLLKSRPNLR